MNMHETKSFTVVMLRSPDVRGIGLVEAGSLSSEALTTWSHRHSPTRKCEVDGFTRDDHSSLLNNTNNPAPTPESHSRPKIKEPDSIQIARIHAQPEPPYRTAYSSIRSFKLDLLAPRHHIPPNYLLNLLSPNTSLHHCAESTTCESLRRPLPFLLGSSYTSSHL
jgi:hypothetical protein